MKPVLLALAVLALAGCGEADDTEGAPAEQVVTTGFLWTDGTRTLLCDAIAESYPPQCGGDSVVVEGLDLTTVADLETAHGISWAEGVELRGTLRRGVLTVR